MSVNLVVIDGVVKSLALKYDSQSKPELRWTLQQTDQGANGQPWVSYWPCCASGTTAERLAGDLEDGQHIVITSGKLCYRKRALKTGEQSRMEILVWAADVLAPFAGAETSPGAETTRASHATASRQEPSSVSETKVGKPRDPKWRPQAERPTEN